MYNFDLGFSKKSCCLPQNTKHNVLHEGHYLQNVGISENSNVPCLELLIPGSQNRSKNLPGNYSFFKAYSNGQKSESLRFFKNEM